MPVYNFCVAVDDASMGITHVVRAEEHLSNTPRQLLVLEALGRKPPIYAHCSLILGSDRSKLSKRHGATSIKQFSEQGFLPEAMMNYLANLGWNDGTDKEIYTPDELVDAFKMDRITKSSAIFDIQKLKWVNSQHIRTYSIDALSDLVDECLRLPPSLFSNDEARNNSVSKILATLAIKDMETINDARALFEEVIQFPFQKTLKSDANAAALVDESFNDFVRTIIVDYEEGRIPMGHEKAFDDLMASYIKELGKKTGRKGKSLFQPLRLALTGRTSGPDVVQQLKLCMLAKDNVKDAASVFTLSERIEVLRSHICTREMTG
jgi:glutamyl-tRNA synthetase